MLPRAIWIVQPAQKDAFPLPRRLGRVGRFKVPSWNETL
jgi:hypothetical protein